MQDEADRLVKDLVGRPLVFEATLSKIEDYYSDKYLKGSGKKAQFKLDEFTNTYGTKKSVVGYLKITDEEGKLISLCKLTNMILPRR